MANGQTRPSHGCGSFGLTDTRRWRSGATWVSPRTPSSARRTASICRDGRRRSARSGKPKRPRRPPVSKEIAMPDAAQCAAHGAHRAIETEAKQPRASPVPPPARSPAWCSAASLLSACQAHRWRPSERRHRHHRGPPERRHRVRAPARAQPVGTPVPRHPGQLERRPHHAEAAGLPVARLTAARPADTLASNTAGAGSRAPQF